MRQALIVLAGLMATGTSAPSGSIAECVVHGTVCTEFRRAQLVFLGEVTAIRNETVPFTSTPAQTATFRIIEAFKGVTGTQITLRLAVDGEAPRVELGDRILVYAPKPGPTGRTMVHRVQPNAIRKRNSRPGTHRASADEDGHVGHGR